MNPFYPVIAELDRAPHQCADCQLHMQPGMQGVHARQARPSAAGPGPRTLARPSRPTVASVCSPSASTRMDSEHLAASTRLILPLNLGCDCPIRLAW